MEAFLSPPYQSPTAPAVSRVVAAAAFAAVVSDAGGVVFDADVGAVVISAAVADAVAISSAEAAALVVAASVDVADAFRSVGHPAAEQGLQPLVSTSQPPSNHRGLRVFCQISPSPLFLLVYSCCGCDTGFFSRYALNRCPVAPQDQQCGCRPSTIISIFRSRHAIVSGMLKNFHETFSPESAAGAPVLHVTWETFPTCLNFEK